ncbi:squamosa promoter-binding protein 15 [Micromonospora sp. R77]|uniref:squamosa promoter-binding protein 15 n=1 Tax=Micromonospora sp. R77 TaxID=2925836 RepID=UPI001F61A7E5|nr:squamosa promoter-binding protein 15 [Micromonospora sp. R77]MCI4066173.1 squamosa promoter-binding protein 15 [Micromonospora sp. R77]
MANLMIQADGADSGTVQAFSAWLEREAPRRTDGTPEMSDRRPRGVGSLKDLTDPQANYWGGWKNPECQLWGGALNHADLEAVLRQVQTMPWRYPAAVQVFLMDQNQTYFRLYMFRDGAWNQYAPPPPPDADEQEAW